jgi:hypothetical protein
VPVTVTDTITVTDTDTDTDAGTVKGVREPDTDRDTVTVTDSVTDTDTDIDTVSTLTMLGSRSAGIASSCRIRKLQDETLVSRSWSLLG